MVPNIAHRVTTRVSVNSLQHYPTSYILCKNLVILLGKWFINSQRSFNTPLNVHFFLNFAKNKLNIYIKLYENAKMDKRVDVRLKDGINLVRRNLNEE